ncbi:MAG: hypothetical protein AABM66_13955 [Actinomycetota bacterium]
MTSQDLYNRLPVALQNLACTAAGARTAVRRYNRSYFRQLRAAQQRGEWSHEEICGLRDARMRAHLVHAATTVPHYRRKLEEAGVDARTVSLADLPGALPVLTKAEVQRDLRSFISPAVPSRKHLIEHTSGTTGGGLRFPTTWQAHRELWATWWRYRGWHGITHGTWCAQLAGHVVVSPDRDASPFWRYNLAGRQILMSGYHLSPENIPAYVAEFRKRRPPWIHGYPSLIALVAQHLVEQGAELGYQLRAVTTGAESLFPQQRELMRTAFGVEPREHYGMAEAVANASECEQGRLHVDEDLSFVEAIPDSSSGLVRIVGTNFSNPAMPLLRYSTDDLAVIGDGRCACGRPGRIIERMDGRHEDFIVLRDGTRVGTANNIFKDATNVVEAQIYQPAPGVVVMRIVPGPAYSSADQARVLDEARLRLRADTEISIERWTRLPRSANGKLRLVVSGYEKA